MTRSRGAGWKDYWKEDRVSSCVPENPSTADEITEWWIGRFADVPGGSRILDVATGNGILLANAASSAERSGIEFDMTGVDLADIEPLHYLSDYPAALDAATFIGGVSAEDLPFSDSAFDIVVSQYGLEYADLDKALAEVERVLCAGGRCLWLAHSKDSLVVQQNRAQGAEVDFLLAPGGPLDAMGQFIGKAKKRRGLDRAGNRLRKALTAAEDFCRSHPPGRVVHEVCTVLAETAQRWHAYDPDDLDRMVIDCRRRILEHRQRINDMNSAVMSSQRLDFVRTRFQERGWEKLSISTTRVGSSPAPIGTLIDVRRTAR